MSAFPDARPRPVRRGIGLIRVSKEREGMTSPEVQRYTIEQYAERQGIRIVEWIEGIDESGSQRKSAWWARLDYAVDKIERGEADTIVVWKFSRTARHRLRWNVALDRVDNAGGTLESATEQTDATPSGRFARGMLGELNAYQAELIGETWKEAHERRRRAGLPASGGPRFGYRIGEDGRYHVDPVSGPVLADMYHRYLRGMGLTAIARHLNATGSPTRTGKPWTRTTVTQVLDAGFGAGLLVRVGDGRGRKHTGVDRDYLPGAHDPVIDRATWEAYVAKRRAADPAYRGGRGGYMLSGIIFCGDCGSRMHGAPLRGDRHYICSRAHEYGDVPKLTMRADLTERVVTDWLFTLAPDLNARAEAMRKQQSAKQRARTGAAAINARIEKVERRLHKLTERLLDGTVSEQTYRSMAQALEEERDTLRAWAAQAASNPAERTALRALPADIEAMWPGMSAEQRALVVRPLVRRVTVLRPPRPGSGVWRRRVAISPSWDADEPEAVDGA